VTKALATGNAGAMGQNWSLGDSGRIFLRTIAGRYRGKGTHLGVLSLASRTSHDLSHWGTWSHCLGAALCPIEASIKIG
jgi:hypothetical protein